MKKETTQISKELFKNKIKIEKELSQGNKVNEDLYLLILKSENFLENKRRGAPIAKHLKIYNYFENKYKITNLFIIDLTKSARAFYTKIANGKFEILQIILEVHQSHKEYEKKGNYTKH